MDKVILLAVGGVVAVGTVLYYLLVEREQPQKQRSRPHDRSASSSQPRSKSPPISYSDIKPGSCRNRKATELKESRVEKSLSEDEVSKISEPDNECEENVAVAPDLNKCEAVGENPEIPDTSDPEEDILSSPEIANENLSSAICRACGEAANATFHPCKHRELCREHAQYYFDIAKNLKREPQCPNSSCRKVLQYFSS